MSYYVWPADSRGRPVGEGPWGPYETLERAKTFARIGAQKGVPGRNNDRIVTRGRDPRAIVRHYQVGTGERLRENPQYKNPFLDWPPFIFRWTWQGVDPFSVTEYKSGTLAEAYEAALDAGPSAASGNTRDVKITLTDAEGRTSWVRGDGSWNIDAQTYRALERYDDNPRRPPKKWWRDCVRGVQKSGSAVDPASVCGALWYRKLSETQRRAAVRKEPKREECACENPAGGSLLTLAAVGTAVVAGAGWFLGRRKRAAPVPTPQGDPASTFVI